MNFLTTLFLTLFIVLYTIQMIGVLIIATLYKSETNIDTKNQLKLDAVELLNPLFFVVLLYKLFNNEN